MAKMLKQVTRPAQTETVIDHIVCELCGKHSVGVRGYPKCGQWDDSRCASIDEVVLYRHKGDIYPEGDFTQWQILDICAECWESKLLPWFAEMGGKARLEEPD